VWLRRRCRSLRRGILLILFLALDGAGLVV